ncbi:MAG: hypothetical protein IJU36_06170 [Paludibacteraceae bacterium]|nr:hypothetical protein [Paludibacteraceae bacterium]
MTQPQAVIETIKMLGANAALRCHNVLILMREERFWGGVKFTFASLRKGISLRH